ncbi:chaperone modulator CbpM [Salinimicrobium oceani]|uniref:MerR family transcriptional regulator n=1 Tax=Salinimicrobium oceani TaxID=2722702 RepID=A0ABX1D102_9FLAO|nr:chaperone modulator CbpM [Salinimicrobium oceani]NJW54170.1 MerR family transcriptional regulator [Salinimicrobium oceani]
MDERYVSIVEFCNCHRVEYSFIHSLNEYGLIETVVIEDNEYIEQERLRDLERLMRLHFDLEINMQGLDAINNLLQKVSGLQQEIRALENRLKRYEDQNFNL